MKPGVNAGLTARSLIVRPFILKEEPGGPTMARLHDAGERHGKEVQKEGGGGG